MHLFLLNNLQKGKIRGDHDPIFFCAIIRFMSEVSVIIPTYNRAEFLKSAVKSVMTQTYRNFELILVDDGSTDNTVEVVKRFTEAKYIYQKNKGVSAARNTGIKAASGEYTAFLDSDDTWKPDKLEKQIEFHEGNPEYLISQTDEAWIRNGKWANPMKKHRKYHGWIFEKCLPLCIVSPSAVMMKKELFDKTGLFDESLPACEDYDLWLRISAFHPIALIDEKLIVKRGGHGDQLSSSVPNLDRYRIKAIEKILSYDNLKPEYRAAALEELEIKCRIYAQGAEKRGKTEEAREYEKIPEKYTIS